MSTNNLWFWQQNRKEEPVRESIPVYAKQYEEGYVSRWKLFIKQRLVVREDTRLTI